MEKFLSHCCFMSGSYDSDGDGYGVLHRRLEAWEELMGAGGGVRDNGGRQNGDNGNAAAAAAAAVVGGGARDNGQPDGYGNGDGATTASSKVRGRGTEGNGVVRTQGRLLGFCSFTHAPAPLS